VVLDSPTNNFATMNHLQPTGNTYTEGNLRIPSLSVYNRGTFVVSSGKWYFEILQDNSSTYNYFMGVIESEPASTAYYVGIGNANGGNSPNVFSVLTNTNGSVTSPTGSRVSNVVIGIALDMDGGNVYFYYNGSLNGKVENITTSEFTGMTAFMASYTGTIGYQDAAVNFGQDSSFAGHKTAGGNKDENGIGDFFHSVPSGYLAMCTANLPDPGIDPATGDNPEDYFDTQLWTGTGSGQSFSNFSFQPDWLWFKQRNGTSDHALFDSVRGVNAGLSSNSTSVENTNASGSQDLVSFDSDGFTTGTPAQYGSLGSSGNTIVTWAWRGGGSAVTNNDGSVTSSVSANTEAGFSIVTHDNGSGTRTVGHGLNSAPELIIEKKRDDSGDWLVQTTVIDGSNDYLRLNTTAAKADGAGASPTSTVYTPNVGGGADCLAYCFHSVDGYSLISTYVGNGSTDGPFVYTGFRPAWLLVKSTGGSPANNGWYIYDNKRNNYGSLVDVQLYANYSSADDDGNRDLDFLSNGFKPRLTDVNVNASGVSYIYLAIAEQPFKYANAR